jgi:putative membrane-bound dehydrogenase-like protein
MLHRIALLLLAAGFATRLCAAEPQVDAAQLPRVPATPPERALSTFKVKPGFRVELVAAEPLVVDPIALSFDEDGRCYVVEMRDYSERRPERLGRIRLLEDTDGDGRFDKSTVFAQDLPWPTAVICWDGGVFVGATPDVIYFKDTNGDGVADIRERVFTGFAADYAPFATNKLNVQALMNSFNWSLDNRIHGATSFSGGKVRLVDSPFVREWIRRAASGSSSSGGEGEQKEARNPKPETQNEVLDLRGRDFSFNPRTLEMRAESGGGQHGLSFDNRGRKFVCSNSSHVQTLMYEERYATRNPFYSMPRALVDIAVDGGAAEVFRISPDEPWRVLRTQWRVSGLVPGPIEGGGRPSGYFTGATGITIYRGDAFGPDFVGDAFVGDAGGNLVHRKKILPDGVGVKAVRPADEQNVEFLASTDTWFRPVQMANAPDGCLYICDMYREVIEHPWSLPDSIKKHLDLNSGNDRGRIYRIVPEKFKQRPLPRLGKASSAELVALLEHPNGWHRDTAARLLFERQDQSSAAKLAGLVNPLRPAHAITHALHALAGLKALKEEHLIYSMWHSKPAVRENALKLVEPFLAKPSVKLWQEMRRLAERPDADPKDTPYDLQLALTLGEARHPESAEVLWRFFRQGTSANPILKSQLPQNNSMEWLEAALVSAREDGAFTLFRLIANDKAGVRSDNRESLLGKLSRAIGARNNSNEVTMVLQFVADESVRSIGLDVFHYQPLLASEVIAGLDGGLRQNGTSLQTLGFVPKLSGVYGLIRAVAVDPHLESEAARLSAIGALATASYPLAGTNLLAIVADAANSAVVRKAAVAALARYSVPQIGNDLLRMWPQLTPSLRTEVLSILMQRTERIEPLLAALENGVVLRSELSVVQRDLLRSHRDAAIREQAEKVLGRAPVAARQSVVGAFQPALALRGQPKNGHKTFQARCISCHKLANEGQALGPDLATVKNAGKEKLLTNILDPNREVNSNYLSYLVETKDGESLAGLIVNESANSVTLRMAGGAESVISRANVVSLQSHGKSLMPEGLEEGLSQQDMADLLEFIVATP